MEGHISLLFCTMRVFDLDLDSKQDLSWISVIMLAIEQQYLDCFGRKLTSSNIPGSDEVGWKSKGAFKGFAKHSPREWYFHGIAIHP